MSCLRLSHWVSVTYLFSSGAVPVVGGDQDSLSYLFLFDGWQVLCGRCPTYKLCFNVGTCARSVVDLGHIFKISFLCSQACWKYFFRSFVLWEIMYLLNCMSIEITCNGCSPSFRKLKHEQKKDYNGLKHLGQEEWVIKLQQKRHYSTCAQDRCI